MEATIACSSSSQTLNYHTSPNPVSYAERIIKRLAGVATPPSSIIELPAPIQRPEEEANSTSTTATTSANSEALTGRSTAATSVLSSPKILLVQNLYVSPSTHMDKELQDVWTDQIFDRLNQTLRVAIPSGICLQEFMHLGRRPNALKPTLVINCGDVHIKRQVEKTFKKQIWLQTILKSKGIMFVALVVKITLSAGPISSHATTNDLTEAYAIHTEPFAHTSCGSKCAIKVKNELPHRNCTLGGVIVVNGAAVGLTAGHPFRSFDEHFSSISEQVTEYPDDDESSDASSEPFVFNDDDDHAVDTSSISSLSFHHDVYDSVAYNHESTGLYDSDRWRWQPSSQVVYSHDMENITTPNGKASSNDLDWAILQGLPEAITSLANRQTHPTSQFSNISETAPSGTCGSVVINVRDDGPRLGYLHSSASSMKLYTSILKVQLVTLDRALSLGSSGAWVTLDDKLCGHIIAVREDIPWAYMVAIQPIFDDIRLRLNTTDVRLPTQYEFFKWELAPQGSAELSGDTVISETDVCNHAADAHEDSTTDGPLTKSQTHLPMVESGGRYNQDIGLNQMSTRLSHSEFPEHRRLENVHGEYVRNQREAVKYRASRRSPQNSIPKKPLTVWRGCETFILRTEYERRMRSVNAVSRRSMIRSWLIHDTRPVYPLRTLSNVAIYYLSMGLSFYRWPLSILYYILFWPVICLVVLRHQTLLMDEEVLKERLQDGIHMLGRLPTQWNDNQIFDKAQLLGVDYQVSGHRVEPPISEMEMGYSNFELPSRRREV